MDREPVDSSSLFSVGYDPTSETLEIEFKGGGVYQYYNVPPVTFEGLMQAPSIGKYFYAFVRHDFACAKV